MCAIFAAFASGLLSRARYGGAGQRRAWRVRAAGIGMMAALSGAAPGLAIVGPSEVDATFTDRVLTILQKGPGGPGYCTAVVLAPTILLTAGHCVRAPRDMAALVRGAAGALELLEVTAVERHPDYRADAPAARRVSIDAALVRLKAPLGATFRAVALGKAPSPAVGDPVLLVGVGETRAGEPDSGGVLRRANLRVRAPLSSILLWSDG